MTARLNSTHLSIIYANPSKFQSRSLVSARGPQRNLNSRQPVRSAVAKLLKIQTYMFEFKAHILVLVSD